jgi:hypothetical protein
LFDILRRGDILVVCWVDRLGRNCGRDRRHSRVHAAGVIKTVINGLTFDGATRDSMQMAIAGRAHCLCYGCVGTGADPRTTKETAAGRHRGC